MLTLLRTNSTHNDFIKLVALLDADLGARDGDDHAFYHQFNGIDTIKYALVAYAEGKPAGCGAIKELESDVTEIKRMYVLPNSRGQGIATEILKELEKWASELGYKNCVLETGKRQPEAISLYEKSGYQRIPNYGQYIGIENSVCFKKNIIFGQ